MERRGKFPFSVTVFCPSVVGRTLAGTDEKCQRGILNLVVREDTAEAAEQGAIEEVCSRFGVSPEDITEVFATIIPPERVTSIIKILSDPDEGQLVSGGTPPHGGAPAAVSLYN